MKVIVNIKNKRSQYAKYNGLTFEVAELMFSSVGLLLNKIKGDYNQTDFSFDEIIIVDLQSELNTYNVSKIEKLKKYSEVKGLNIDSLLPDSIWL